MKSSCPILLIGLLLTGLIIPLVTMAAPGMAPSPLSLLAISTSEGEVPAGLPVLARLPGDHGSLLLVLADPLQRRQMVAAGVSLQTLDRDARDATYVLAAALGEEARAGILPQWERYGRVLWQDETQVLLRTTSSQIIALAAEKVEVKQLRPRPFRPRPRVATDIPSDVASDPLIQSLIGQIGSGTVRAYAAQLSGAWSTTIGGEKYTIATRNTYSGEPIRKATQFVGQHLTELGLGVTYHNWESSDYPNVIGELPGRTHPEQILLICAHLDDMPAGSLAPGADDNASGVTGVLAAADILSQQQWDVTIRFALWTGEEQGLLGSAAYAAEAAAAGEEIIGVLNMDMIGYDSDADPILDLHARSWLPNSVNMANLLADVVGEYDLPLQPEVLVDNWLGNYSDNASFWGEGYPAILVIEDNDDFNPDYHTVADRLANLNEDYFTAMVQATVGTAAHIAGYIPEPDASGTLSGTVSAADSGAPIPGASVAAQATTGYFLATTTMATGVYTAVLPADSYTLTVSAPHYLTTTSTGIVLPADTIVVHDVALMPAPVQAFFLPLIASSP